MSGYIKLHRSLLDHPLWSDDEKFSKRDAFIDLIFRCNHRCRKVLIGNTLTLVKRGQFISSNYKLAESWKWSEAKVRTFLKLLNAEGMVTFNSCRSYTLYEVQNYNAYQSIDNTEFELDMKRTKNAQKTHRQRTVNAPSTPNKNEKNEKNEKNTIPTRENSSISSIIENYQKYLGDHNIERQQRTLEYLDKGIDADVIIECIRDAAIQGTYPAKYLFGMLDKCVTDSVYTLATYIAKRKEHEQRRSQIIKDKEKDKTQTHNNFEQRTYTDADYQKYFVDVTK